MQVVCIFKTFSANFTTLRYCIGYFIIEDAFCFSERPLWTLMHLISVSLLSSPGTLLCIVLVYCNLAVIKALYAITTPRGAAPLVRRVSKTSCRQRQRTLANGDQPMHHNAATAEEVAFSRLMATLSVMFMICWLPQMVRLTVTIAIIGCSLAVASPGAATENVRKWILANGWGSASIWCYDVIGMPSS